MSDKKNNLYEFKTMILNLLRKDFLCDVYNASGVWGVSEFTGTVSQNIVLSS